MMDYNQTFIQFPAADFAPPPVFPGFRSFSISSGKEDGELDKLVKYRYCYFLRQQFSIVLISQEHLGAA